MNLLHFTSPNRCVLIDSLYLHINSKSVLPLYSLIFNISNGLKNPFLAILSNPMMNTYFINLFFRWFGIEWHSLSIKFESNIWCTLIKYILSNEVYLFLLIFNDNDSTFLQFFMKFLDFFIAFIHLNLKVKDFINYVNDLILLWFIYLRVFLIKFILYHIIYLILILFIKFSFWLSIRLEWFYTFNFYLKN